MSQPRAARLDVEDKEIAFADALPPPLEAGNYQITVEQVVTPGTMAGTTYVRTYPFTVKGPRFSLDPSFIDSVFPPPNAVGQFASCLPQVVFAIASLPWQRSVDPAVPPVRGAAGPPFVGIMLLDNDLGPVMRTVKDLLQPGAGILGPAISELDRGQSPSDPVLTVDIPAADFQALAPSLADLALLAHARKMSVEAKATPISTPDGWYSAVFGNRLPAPGARSYAYLVSFEGSHEYLPGPLPAGTTSVRLAVFSSWSFVDTGIQAGFLDLAGNLSTGLLELTPTKPPVSDTEKAAATAFQMGYVAMNHTTRQGENTVSWYRGPLAPLLIEQDPIGVRPNPDAALRFAPGVGASGTPGPLDAGLLDVSYAVAWEIGRLLALQNRQFAASVHAWRQSNQQRALRLAGRVSLARRFPGLKLPARAAALLNGQLVRSRLPDLLLAVGELIKGEPGGPTAAGLGRLADPSGLETLVDLLPGLVPRATMLERLKDEVDPVAVVQAWLTAISSSGARAAVAANEER